MGVGSEKYDGVREGEEQVEGQEMEDFFNISCGTKATYINIDLHFAAS